MDYGLCLLKGIPTNHGEIMKVMVDLGPSMRLNCRSLEVDSLVLIM